MRGVLFYEKQTYEKESPKVLKPLVSGIYKLGESKCFPEAVMMATMHAHARAIPNADVGAGVVGEDGSRGHATHGGAAQTWHAFEWNAGRTPVQDQTYCLPRNSFRYISVVTNFRIAV